MAEQIENPARVFKIAFTQCFTATCDGLLKQLSYYERNNWVTAEYRCEKCRKEFTVKVES